jgi:molybdate transport system ATP-binding protein
MSLLNLQCRHRYPSGFQLDVAFDVEHRFTALFGPSGSGKTSILNMIAGFTRPQEGTIRLGDRTVLDTRRRVSFPPERRHVGVVFQDSLLFPHLNVERNLRYGQRHRRAAGAALDFSRVVEVLEIGHLLKRFPLHLSGGERQRIALGRALLSSPQLLLMDEPLAALDLPLRERILGYLQRAVARWGIPTLFITHAQAEVRRAADWVLVLEKGRLIAGGTPEEALSRPEPLSWTNSAGPTNLLRLEQVEMQGSHLMARIGGQLLYLPPQDGALASPLFVQFSPHDVVLSRQDIAGLSVRNHLRGRVCQVAPVNNAVFIAVDIGQILWAQVTPEAAIELELKPGSEITCLLKTHSLTILG